MVVIVTVAISLAALAFLALTAALPVDSPWNLLPTTYKPTASVLVQSGSSSSSLAAAFNQNSLNSLSGILSGSLGGANSSAQLAQILLRGRTIEDGVAEKFDFVKRYNLGRYPKTSARSRYEKSLRVKFDDKSGVLVIGYVDIDPQFATMVVNDIVDRLQQQFVDITVGKVLNRRIYLEKTIANQQVESNAAAARLTAFQNLYGVYDLTAQTQANITELATLQSQLASKRADLDLQRNYVPESDARITVMKEQLAQLQRQIDLLKTGGKDSSKGTVSLSQMASLSSEYATLKTDVQVQQAVLLTLKQQYEAAKVAQQDTSPSFQIVERAEVPEMRSGPGRSKIEVICTAAGLLIAVLVAFVLEYFEVARRDPEEKAKLQLIRASLTVRRRNR